MKVEDKSEQTIKSYVRAIDRLIRFHVSKLHRYTTASSSALIQNTRSLAQASV